ncbi:ABC transporter substrate-binding protein [Saccharomonospora xinjiangensis]|uniref:ABC transporter substrate-binding protein n=1 Tax=Saccharomonospora xinjiangensis TaxID=75294 RepID=UPI0035109C44
MHLSRRSRVLALAVLLVLATVSCGAPAPSTPGQRHASEHYPVTVTNCGAEVTFDGPPRRIVLLDSSPVPVLSALGVLDSVALRAGAFPAEYYDPATTAAIEAIPSLGEDLDTSGHLRISAEVIIEQQPDLVLGLPDGITREGLADVGIAALVHPTLCPSGVDTATSETTFDDVYDHVTTFGRIFDRRDEAESLVASLRHRVAAVEAAATAAEGRPRRTAAVLYPTVGGGTVYAYGNRSMAHPQLEAAGFTNVYADVGDRVFEVTTEDLIGKNPDVLVLLHTDGDPRAVHDAVVGLPGAGALQAVRDGTILVQLFNFTEPATPLSVAGLERIHAAFGGGS